MNNTRIKLTNEIFNKFINPFDLNLGNYIGLELEFPIVNLKMLKNNMEIMQKLMQLLINKADFKPLEFDNNGNISSIINNLNDQISFEYSINTLEFSLAKSESLPKIENVCINYISIIQEFLSDHNSILTGFGIHPFYQQIDKKPINNNRYKVIHHFLKKENDLFSEFVAYTSSSQVHINANSSNLPTIINTFSKIEWIRAILFSNSVMYLNKDDLCDVTCARDFLWQNSNFSFNRNNVGVYDKKFESIEDLIQDILERFMFYTVRNEQYIRFNPLPIKDYFYFSKISGVVVNNNGGRIREVEFEPMIDDLNYFRSVDGDEKNVAVPGCTYMTPQYSIPGTGTLKIAALAGNQKATKTQTGGKAVLLKGGNFTAKFEVQNPAKQPPPGPGSPIPDATPQYSGQGMFVSTNIKFQGA